jgi:hypothetical protein
MANHKSKRPWHHVTVKEAARFLETDLFKGQARADVAKRLETCGPNTLITRKTQGPLIRFMLQFNQPLVMRDGEKMNVPALNQNHPAHGWRTCDVRPDLNLTSTSTPPAGPDVTMRK